MDAARRTSHDASPFERRTTTGLHDPDAVRRGAVGRRASFDRLAGLAARLVRTPLAQVCLVDDVHRVVGWSGGDADLSALETPVAESICALTVQQGAVVAIGDTRTDDRVRHLSAVAEGVVGAYLGAPLVSGGQVVGTLCVTDARPRSWSSDDVSVLEALVGPVVAELEIAALGAAYDEDRLLWEVAVDAAEVGVWDWDLATGELRWDDRLLQVFGRTRESFGGTIEAFGEMVHPDDRDRVNQALAHAIDTCGDYAADYRVPLAHGVVRRVAARGRALAGPDRRAVRVLGAAYDTTALHDGAARVQRVLESMPVAYYHLDHSWRFTAVNSEAQRLLGAVSADVRGEVLWETFPLVVGTQVEHDLRRAVATGRSVSFESYYPAPLDAWYEVRVWPEADGLAVYFLEVTERHRVQEKVARDAARDALLAEATRSLTDTLDVAEAATRLAEVVTGPLADWCVVSLVDDGRPGVAVAERIRDVGWAHADPAQAATLTAYVDLRTRGLAARGLAVRAFETGEPVVATPSDVAAAAGLGPAREVLQRLRTGAGAVLPLRGRGRIIGVLTVTRDRDREPFDEEDLQTLRDLAVRAGLALDNLRAYDEQRDLAEGLQRSLLTAPPRHDGAEIAVRYAPASRAAQVGGDWYDAFLTPGGALALVIGDVVGHDTAAAAAMSQVRSLVRGIAVTSAVDPASVLAQTDAAISSLQMETTATAVVAQLEGRRLRWSNAGHPPPLVTGAPGAARAPARELETDQPDLLLGLDPVTARRGGELELDDGAVLLLYTDGLVERRGEGIDEGVARLARVLDELLDEGLGLEELCDELLRRTLPERPDDDVALVAVRLSGRS